MTNPTKTDRFYVNTPTKAIWNKVVRKLLDEYGEWAGYIDKRKLMSKLWKKHTKDTCVCFNCLETNKIGYEDSAYHKTEGLKFIPYQEFLGEEKEKSEKPIKLYTISTLELTYPQAQKLIREWAKQGTLRKGTKIFEVLRTQKVEHEVRFDEMKDVISWLEKNL